MAPLSMDEIEDLVKNINNEKFKRWAANQHFYWVPRSKDYKTIDLYINDDLLSLRQTNRDNFFILYLKMFILDFSVYNQVSCSWLEKIYDFEEGTSELEIKV